MALSIFLVTIGTLSIYCFATIVYRIWLHPLAKFPGPFLAKFTEFYSFHGVLKENRTLRQVELLNRYGSPVRFSTNHLVFSDLETVTDIYGQSSSLPPKDRGIFDALSATGEKNILNTADRHAHGRLRRLVSHGFSLNTLLQPEGLVMAKVEQYLDLVFRGKENTVVDMYRRTHELSLDIISLMAFEESFNTLGGRNPTALQDVEAFGEVVPPQAFFPGFRYLPLRAVQEGFRGLARLEKFANSCVDAYSSKIAGKISSSNHTSLLSNMIDAQDTETGTRLTKREVVENTIIFLVAGSSTTAITTTYLIWECCRRPEVLLKLTKEIREAFQDPNVMPTFAEASKLVGRLFPQSCKCFILHVMVWCQLNTLTRSFRNILVTYSTKPYASGVL
jgi:cytochrome P450